SRVTVRPVFSSNSGVPPVYMVPSGSPNGFNPFAASSRSRHDCAGGLAGAGRWQPKASGTTRVAHRVMAAILPGRGEECQMTPLLRWGNGLLKLEMFRPRGAVSDRAPPPEGVPELSGNQALSFARAGGELALGGSVTHEMREALKIWGARVVPEGTPWKPDPEVFARTLGAELLEQLEGPPPLIVGPAGESGALLGALAALRRRWPEVRGVALVAADAELPDLPRSVDLPAGIQRLPVRREDAARARARVGREIGLLANHAAALHVHEHGGVAFVTAPGEREFSLEAQP